MREDGDGFFILARSVYDKNLMICEAYAYAYNIFGKVKSVIHLFDTPVHYCPMCGRCLDDDLKKDDEKLSTTE